LLIPGRGKPAIDDHFDKSFELEHHIAEDSKYDRLERVREISDLAKIHYVRQPEPAGLGDAVLQTKKFVGEEAFAVLLGDDIIYNATPPTLQLIEIQEDTGASAFSVMDVPPREV
jgi:UTP--glucose-1-phosphate uridylyltransferase